VNGGEDTPGAARATGGPRATGKVVDHRMADADAAIGADPRFLDGPADGPALNMRRHPAAESERRPR